MISFTRQDAVGILRIDAPKTRNALDWGLQREFAAIVNDCSTNDSLRALVIAGTGKTFIAGGNIRDQVEQFDVETGAQLKRIMTDALQQLTRLPMPTFAAINGDAYGGGCEIITACDLRVMSAEAKLHFVQARMGLTTGWGGGARLVHLIGASRAMELLLTARGISAESAHSIGLIHRVVENDVLSTTVEWASAMIQLPDNALAALKQLVWQSDSLAAGYSAEETLFTAQWQHPNHIEAVNAFVEKRRPIFNRSNN